MIQQEKNRKTNIKLWNAKLTLNFLRLFGVLFCVGFALLPFWAEAVELNLTSQSQEIRSGDQFEAGFFLNTDNEDINAVEGKIVFPADLLELKEIRDGNSIINFWIERPSVSRQTDAKQERETNANIVFSGIIPGGYLGKKGLIFSVVFQSIQEGQGSIEIRDIKALLNDGKGTAANVTISNLQFVISGQAPASQPAAVERKDADMPEVFEPIVTSDPAVLGGKYFLVFATQDKGSGIDHYEIQENRKQKIENRMWIEAESPYVLKDQNLKSYIYVKAVDKAENERVAVVEPRYPLKWYEQPLIWVIIILGIAIGYILWRRLKNLESRK